MIAEAIKVAEDSVPASGHVQINDELLFGPPVPTLVDLSKEAQMIVVGCRGQGALSGPCSARSAPAWSTTPTAPSR